MSYVIVNEESGEAWRRKGGFTARTYSSKETASRQRTRLMKEYGNTVNWNVMSVEDYAARPVKMVERINLMTGEKYMEPEDTPYFCSPSSETYWSS